MGERSVSLAKKVWYYHTHLAERKKDMFSFLLKQCDGSLNQPVRIIRLLEGVTLTPFGTRSGSSHLGLQMVRTQAGLNVAVINPFRSRKFADALGQVAKTDPIDASVLARFAALLQPAPTIPPSKIQKALRDLIVARRQVLAETGTLKRQLSETDHSLAVRQFRVQWFSG